jgi:hypothetical protein
METQIAKMTTITLVLTGGLVLGSVPPSIARSDTDQPPRHENGRSGFSHQRPLAPTRLAQ